MPVTSIKATQGDKETHLQFITTSIDSLLEVEIYLCNEQWIPQLKVGRSVDERSEEEYHKQLRKDAYDREQLVKKYCTDPEWNPDFNPDLYENILPSDLR